MKSWRDYVETPTIERRIIDDVNFSLMDDEPEPAEPAEPKAAIPAQDAFGNRVYLPGDFKDCVNLLALADKIVAARPERFAHLRAFSLDIRWRKEGGTENRRPLRGKVKLISGELKAYSDSHFLVWIAADHAAKYELTEPQVEQLLTSLLYWTGADEALKPILVKPDLVMHLAEAEDLGLWRPELLDAAPVFKQLMIDF